jgi:2-oxoglutarate ferredoxin oxidoreductase subunit alpha
MPKPIEATNDFVVKFANTNGSGSASANELFARAILRMGVPIAVRNIFPSNIQGLPTWYEVRVSGEGWIGRRGGVDFVIAMNGQTWDKDVKELEPGGYLVYDSTKPMPQSKFRADINVIGVPLTEMANSRYDIPRDRQLLKNMIYVGAVGALLDMDHEEMVKLVAEQYAGKDRLIKPNVEALGLGRDYVLEHLKGKCGLSVKRADKVGDRIFVAGNDAAGTRSRRRRRLPRRLQRIAKSFGSIPKRRRTSTPSSSRKTSCRRSAR